MDATANGTARPDAIRLEAVAKQYPDGTTAVRALDLAVTAGEMVALVGPSGCGKTTTLKMINRLIEPSSGRILLDGEDVTRADATQLRRRIGYVIQSGGLFPHRTVLDNVGTVPSLLGWDKRRTRARATELLELVGLDPAVHGPRYPHQLSGGQRQRVGVARALAADPPVLLMDEPFGAVDPVVRDRLQVEFLRLQEQVGKTVVLVTHDIDEAVRLGDRIAVLSEGGVLEQYDTPAAVLGSPATDFVAGFVGADRGLKRLSVTEIAEQDLDHPPVVRVEQSLAEAAEVLRREGASWAVCVDEGGALRGWVGIPDTVRGSGTVGEACHRMEAWVPARSTLKHALQEMLQHDAGWVAVLDGARYLGVLTPKTLHEALRRSVDSDALGVDLSQAEVDSIPG
ncbi:osmoprotectant transport system ATP-binding protein [Motilibacter rhizosphaerae]|uniref:ABC-type quaternary amine transporter n=1 Tax=Motilibacter rhizosphaerae TaxID=598652 RepID=A0A4Q7NAL5_9ACTN|nr:betaine/proline/choline family ABC transporter ATP-binding protein [Motilibacter rhizosphaerae]RZS79435.1 osmoprotectant transport system ATP-binding protein [Motilibacter rhizosphaerae]